jgi:nicotinamidase/pyrazinamidase
MLRRKFVFWEVDVQADFMLPGGKLYVPGAEKIISNVQRLVGAALEANIFIVSSADAHSEHDPEFSRFPPHCIRGTAGAQIIPEALAQKFLLIPNDSSFRLPDDFGNYPQVVIEKQTLNDFDNPLAGEIVQRLGPDAEYVVFGVVTEFCVMCAASGLLERGRKVSIVSDAIETLNSEDGDRTLDELESLGARMVTTKEILSEIRAVAGPSHKSEEKRG